jgi:hypothetical protein
MDLFELRNWFAHRLCDYLREKDEEALSELLLAMEVVEKGEARAEGALRDFPLFEFSEGLLKPRESEIDPFTKEYLKDKVKRYKEFLRELGEDFEPALEDKEKNIELSRLLFAKGLYFEVHELLEEVWAGEFGKDRELLQALIQIGVAYYHLNNFNQRGFELLIQNALELLKQYQGKIYGINLEKLKEELKEALKSQKTVSF